MPGRCKQNRIWTHYLRWILAGSVIIGLLAGGIPAISMAEARVAEIMPASLPSDGRYDPHPALFSTPGALLQRERLTNSAVPEGAQAWRIQYTTTAPDDSPATAMATVLAPADLPDGPMPVIAWDHGAVGLAQRCLPSVSGDPWTGMPALETVVAQGWLVVATDYQTDANGIHPFLIGEGEARSTLDAVRALREMPDLPVDDRTVVWGHSQGGHAALWTSMIAQSYAPDVGINGVIAISPPTSLVSLLDRQRESSAAPILGAWLASAYSAYYPDVDYDTIVTESALEPGRELTTRCPSEPLDSAAIALLLGELGNSPLLVLPAPEAFRARLEENEPDGDYAAPVVIAQGLNDMVVLADLTARFVAAQCATGAVISYWTLPGQDHLSLVQPGSPLEDPLTAWTRERFAGMATVTTCSERTITGAS